MMGLDLRSRLAVFFGTVFLASTLSKDTVFFLLTVLLCLYIFASGYGRLLTGFIAFILIIAVFRFAADGKGFGTILPDMFLFLLLRTSVIILSAVPIIKTSPGELMAVMGKMKIHRNISLPLIFMLRFLPVVKNDFLEIMDSLRLRGLFSIKRPLAAMEYLFVPMMFSASKITEELAAAAEVRGISAKGTHTSRWEIRLRKRDVLVILITLLTTGGLYWMEGAVVEWLK